MFLYYRISSKMVMRNSRIAHLSRKGCLMSTYRNCIRLLLELVDEMVKNSLPEWMRGTGQHITMKTVVGLPVFLRLWMKNTRCELKSTYCGHKLALAVKSALCYTAIRRGCDSRLFLVEEEFTSISLFLNRIFTIIYMEYYAVSERSGIRNGVTI